MYVVAFLVAAAAGGVLALAFWIEQRVWRLWRARKEGDDAP
jgi:HAMP domain-containing protein